MSASRLCLLLLLAASLSLPSACGKRGPLQPPPTALHAAP